MKFGRQKIQVITQKLNGKWSKNCVPYNPYTKHCLLYLIEKLENTAYKQQNLLNKRNKIKSKC